MKSVVLGAAAGGSLGLALAVRTTLRVPIFEDGAEGSAPWLLSSLPELHWVFFAVAFGGLAGAVLGWRGRAELATPFLPSGLAAAIFLPGVFAAAPFLAAFSGAFLDLVLLAGLLLATGRFLSTTRLARAAPAPGAVAAAAFVLYASVGLELLHDVGISGDEPHYLLVTYSLLHDHDLRVQDNYGNEDYRHFYNGKIGPHLAEGTPYSVHGIGVPLLLLPGFALAGLFGVVVTEALLSALLVTAVYRASLELTENAGVALLAAAGFGLTAPALFLSVSAYPELPSALVVVSVARRLLDPKPPATLAAFAWLCALGTLPLLHVKFVPLATVLALAFLARFRGHRASLLGAALGAASSLAALLVFSAATTGSFDPTASYGRQRIFFDRIPIGAAGLLFDQEFGLLINSPFYALGLAGLSSLFRCNRFAGALAGLVLLSVLLPGAAHPLWSGGSSPPARFLFPALPLLALGAACLLARERKWGLGPWAPSLLAASVAIASAMFFLPGQPLYLNARSGRARVWDALSSSWDLTDYFPSLVRADARSIAWALGLALLLLALATAQAGKRPLRLPPFAALLLLGALLQDATSAARSRALESRWALAATIELARRGGESFLALPELERLDFAGVAGRVAVPLERDPRDSDPAYWWSRTYSLPAGRFELLGVPDGTGLCNGEGCFAEGERTFSSSVALARFRLRSPALPHRPRARLLEPRAARGEAVRTISFGTERRLHGLDDEAYLDPGGFWIKKSSSASFALENLEDSDASSSIRIANGGVSNRVELQAPESKERFLLGPWEEREVPVSGEGTVLVFSIRSESGFRPSDLDPASRDGRELGVLLRAEPAFDSLAPVPDNVFIDNPIP